MKSQIWTDAQFEEMSWHDNHVHGLRVIETGNGEGDLVLDVDHIVEWLNCEGAGFNFRIVPVTLTFHGVMFPRISLDYAASTVAFGPFMIHSIERRIEQRTHYVAQLWKILISSPRGGIEFEGRGFTQQAHGKPILSSGQCLTPEQRGHTA